MINVSALRKSSVESANREDRSGYKKREISPLAREIAAANRHEYSRGSQPEKMVNFSLEQSPGATPYSPGAMSPVGGPNSTIASSNARKLLVKD